MGDHYLHIQNDQLNRLYWYKDILKLNTQVKHYFFSRDTTGEVLEISLLHQMLLSDMAKEQHIAVSFSDFSKTRRHHLWKVYLTFSIWHHKLQCNTWCATHDSSHSIISMHLGSVHTSPEIRKRSVFSTVRPTHWSGPKTKLFENALQNRRNLKTPASRFTVDGKRFENGAVGKRRRYDDYVISLPKFSSNTNPK